MQEFLNLLTADLVNLIFLIIAIILMVLAFKLKDCVFRNKFIAFYKYDFLTNLELRQDLDQKISSLFNTQTPFFFTLIDINNLHIINKTQGYRAGDKVIQEVANELKLLMKKQKTSHIYRIGGDEFVIISTQDISNALNPLKKASFCSTFYNNDKTYNDLFDEADNQLMQIKQQKIQQGEFLDRRKSYR